MTTQACKKYSGGEYSDQSGLQEVQWGSIQRPVGLARSNLWLTTATSLGYKKHSDNSKIFRKYSGGEYSDQSGLKEVHEG